MKKVLVLVVALTLLLTGCGSNQSSSSPKLSKEQIAAQASVQTFMDETQSFDLEALRNSYSKAGQAQFDEAKIGNQTEAFNTFFKSTASKLSYKIVSSEVVADVATVYVNVTYVDATNQLISAFTKSLAGLTDKSTAEQVSKAMDNAFTSIVLPKPAKLAQVTLELDLVLEEGSWKLDSIKDDYMNVLYSNFITAMLAVSQQMSASGAE